MSSPQSGKGCLSQCKTYGAEAPFKYSCKNAQSPSALGLLLKSSVFRELLKKNSHLSEEESDDENSQNPLQGSSGGNGVVLDDAPLVFSSSGHEIELQRRPHSYYDCLEITDGCNTGMTSIC